MSLPTITFGPVPSRRLGRSLGINNIPPKVCSYSCVYCQVGRTDTMQIVRQPFYDPKSILVEDERKINKVMELGETIDFLAFVPDGEPTLDINIGRKIGILRPLGVKIAVISNASLIWQKNVRTDLAKAGADWSLIDKENNMSKNNKVCHFQKGDEKCKIAFVLSTPGSKEETAEKPASGDTGKNITESLKILNKRLGGIFPSRNKDFYRITNATTEVMFKAISCGRTESKGSLVTDNKNIERVKQEVSGMEVVILCGKKAQLLEFNMLCKSVVKVCHPGNTGLNINYNNTHHEMNNLSSGTERRLKRIELWALEIIEAIENID